MKVSEVPQDDVTIMHGEKKAVCAIDHQGRYTFAASKGWEAEAIVLKQVIDDFEEKAEDAASRVRKNETSPIEYFMFKKWMDPITLAQAMGLYRWQVRRHFRPVVFKKLSDNTLAEYAHLFGVSVNNLKNFRGED